MDEHELPREAELPKEAQPQPIVISLQPFYASGYYYSWTLPPRVRLVGLFACEVPCEHETKAAAVVALQEAVRAAGLQAVFNAHVHFNTVGQRYGAELVGDGYAVDKY